MQRDNTIFNIIIHQVLSGDYPEQFLFCGEQCIPMTEYQWEEYVENLRKV